jgi:hypothetical protein
MVLRLVNRLGRGADELDSVLGQRAALGQPDRGVQGRLAAHRRQQGVRPLPFDHLLHHVQGDGLHVGPVGQLRIGHDRGRIAVDQHHPVAFFLEGLAGLGAGIVELAGLPDDDGAGADQENGLDVGAFRHTVAVSHQLSAVSLFSANFLCS